jgi:hypothetical protein
VSDKNPHVYEGRTKNTKGKTYQATHKRFPVKAKTAKGFKLTGSPEPIKAVSTSVGGLNTVAGGFVGRLLGLGK